MKLTLAQTLITIALKEVGVQEVGSSNRGPRVDDYQRATWLAERDWGPWCAAFVCFCVREAMRAIGIKETATFKRPQTAGAWDFERWSHEQDDSTQTQKPPKDIKAGDIVIFTFSHIGIAVHDAKDGAVMTVEGNTNAKGSRTGGMVCVQTRSLSLIRSRIRFTV